MRLALTSLALVGFSVAAGLVGCGSDREFGPSGSAGNAAAGAGTHPIGSAGTSTVGSAGAAGTTVVGGAGTGTGTGGTGTGSAGSASGLAGSGSGLAGSSPAGGSTGSAGSGSAGAAGKGGSGGSATVDPNAPDQMGKTNAKPGDKATAKFDYLKMGEIRLLNNNWGSAAWGCTDKAPQSVFVNADKTFGWSFDRPDCDTGNTNTKPDFPQIEFGIHPFGLGSSDATSPNFSSTAVLPKQIKDIKSASVTLTNLTITLEKEASWDLTFEFWLSTKNPATTQSDAGVYAELMTFWGWQANRWPETGMSGSGPLVRNSTCSGSNCPKAGEQVSAGKTYKLTVQDDAWGKWRYFQFRDTAGPGKTFASLTVDVKKLIDYLVSKGYSQDLWVARLEVGSEIDDMTKGSVKMSNVEFEVNGEKRTPVFGQ